MHHRNRARGLSPTTLACVLAAALCASCQPAAPDRVDDGAAERAGQRRLDLLEQDMGQIALERKWAISADVFGGGQILEGWIQGDDLFLETFQPATREYELHAIDARSGVPRWVVVLGSSRLKFEPRAGSRWVVCLLADGGGMVVIDRQIGSREFRMRAGLELVPAGPAASGSTSVYVASLVDESLHAISPDTGQSGWHYRAQGTISSGPRVTPELPSELVVFGTDAGEVLALPAAGWNAVPPQGASWQRQLLGPVGAELTVHQTMGERGARTVAIVPCEDKGLYCLDMATGESRWVFRSAAPFHRQAIVANGRVYARNEDRLIVVGLEDGLRSWPASGPGEFKMPYEFAERGLTGDDQRAYLDAGRGRVLRVDGRTGEVQATATLESFDMLLEAGGVNLLIGLTTDGNMVAWY